MMHHPGGDPPPPSEAYWAALLAQGEVAPRDGAGRLTWPEPLERPRGRPAARSEAQYSEEFWTRVEALCARGTAVDVQAIGCNKGGLLVRLAEGIAFVPASQLDQLPAGLGTAALRDELQALVGSTLLVRIIEIDRDRARIICSERAVTWQDDLIATRLAALAERVGGVEHGVVRSVCDFGAFVDLGGVEGLVHISELSWQRVGHPSEVVQADQAIDVVVLKVDCPARRVALSLKRLLQDPWQVVAARYAVGDRVEATISSVVDYGAFARLPEGIDGLIHISELADGEFRHPSSVIAPGTRVVVRVLHIDAAGRRLGLSLRQA
jgi:small subunit ribosomal protein S1